MNPWDVTDQNQTPEQRPKAQQEEVLDVATIRRTIESLTGGAATHEIELHDAPEADSNIWAERYDTLHRQILQVAACVCELALQPNSPDTRDNFTLAA